MNHRNSHYGLIFIFLGVIAGLVSLTNGKGLDSETIWFLAAGVLGFIATRVKLNNTNLEKPYDLIIGLIFAIVGIIGILAMFKVNILPTSLSGSNLAHFSGQTPTEFIGLGLSGFQSLIYAYLGFTSLNHFIQKGK